MIKQFQITLKHYKTIIKQGLDNLPEEAGGFIGGKDGSIRGILPLFNGHLYDKTATFSFTGEDVERAQRFFNKHNLEYYGLYHTHPEGVAYPSQADIDTGCPYHFIVSYKDPAVPIFAVFYIQNKTPIQIPLDVIPDDGFEGIDIRGAKKDAIDNPYSISTLEEDALSLHDRIENIKEERKNSYPKMLPRHQDRSDFSTLA
jgi:proteasome lid subunit RPN8/RPN11